MKAKHRLGVAALLLLPLLLALCGVGSVLFARQGGFAPYRVPPGGRSEISHDPAALSKGEYLAQLGNCAACHTARGGTPFAGGRAFDTAYGRLYSTNLTPDPRSGIGDWSREEFAHTLRNGVSRHGVLYPVFPYAHFALLHDDDIAAIYDYLQSLPAVAASASPNTLDFPASWRPTLIAWRMLYYRPAETEAIAAQDRGRYLTDGVGHCTMCHSRRGEYASLPPQGYLAGGVIPMLGWYAPPLDRAQLQRYSDDELAQFLRSGHSDHGDAYGPMAEVVVAAMHAASADDALAIARYLKSVPAHPSAPQARLALQTQSVDGGAVYQRVCADCHGAEGRGKTGRYPALSDAVALTAPDPINAIRIVLYGGLAPATEHNPRPYSMPPFVYQLSTAEIAAVLNYTRHTFGHRASALDAAAIDAAQGIVLE